MSSSLLPPEGIYIYIYLFGRCFYLNKCASTHDTGVANTITIVRESTINYSVFNDNNNNNNNTFLLVVVVVINTVILQYIMLYYNVL